MTNADHGNERMIDRWFPCDAVDVACGTPVGSGRNEKALFPWFASRPIAQARAAVLTALLPDDERTRRVVAAAVEDGGSATTEALAARVLEHYGRAPVVLDLFSGRGIIPLEAARAGATAVGTDLSPVATLAGRLLGDWPLRDWSDEAPLPYADRDADSTVATDAEGALDLGVEGEKPPRLLADVLRLHQEIGARLRSELAPHYPAGEDGRVPWAYLWVVTMPCDGCKRRFPIFGATLLRHPRKATPRQRKKGIPNDPGQAFRLVLDKDAWSIEVHEGPSDQASTYSSSGVKNKSARCPFPECRHVHSLETVKAKGFAGEFVDEPIIAADFVSEDDARKTFRELRPEEREAALSATPALLPPAAGLSPVPDEKIPAGNVHTIMASGYGYATYGEMMCDRQALLFGTVSKLIRECYDEMLAAGLSQDYSGALASYAAATQMRMIKRATRGAKLLSHGSPAGTGSNRVQADHIFANEASLSFQFDFLEVSISEGPATWSGLTKTGLRPLAAHLTGLRGRPGKFRRANAMALPFRDATVDAVITDPPYYDMIEYADASDMFYVWLRRSLTTAQPDLFAEPVGTQISADLQDKDNEIIVRRVYNGGIKHDKQFYEASLARSFGEARRVLRPDGHLVVVFGHSDPEAWKRLLGALHDAGFVVTSSWPSRTEAANTGVASIKVTVTIGCRVAAPQRSTATADQVDGEVADAVRSMVPQWEADGLALPDQMMAAYGPAMEVYGRYERILKPNGEDASLSSYLLLARRAVRDATALKLDQMPLETFDPATRVAAFWLRAYGRTEVGKGEALFLAQLDGLRIEDLRDRILRESKTGFRLLTDKPVSVAPQSSTFEVVRAMAAAWDEAGTEGAGAVLVDAERLPNDEHVWAVVGELVNQLPSSDVTSRVLTSIQRNRDAVAGFVLRSGGRTETKLSDQLTLDDIPSSTEVTA